MCNFCLVMIEICATRTFSREYAQEQEIKRLRLEIAKTQEKFEKNLSRCADCHVFLVL